MAKYQHLGNIFLDLPQVSLMNEEVTLTMSKMPPSFQKKKKKKIQKYDCYLENNGHLANGGSTWTHYLSTHSCQVWRGILNYISSY